MDTGKSYFKFKNHYLVTFASFFFKKYLRKCINYANIDNISKKQRKRGVRFVITITEKRSNLLRASYRKENGR